MWLYLALLVVLCSGPTLLDAVELRRKIWQSRIVNGKQIWIEDAPWQVALLNHSELSCGGSIISEDIILTAAQCLINTTAEQLTVRAGSSRWNSGGQLVKVSDFIIHQHFGEETHENDIALLRLARPLRLGGVAQAIQIAKEYPANGADAFVSGWGASKYNRDCGCRSQLRGVWLKIIDRTTCAQSKYSMVGWAITKDMICASDQGKAACGRDAGGPLVSNNELVGIVSWGEGCAKPGFPGVYANVAYFAYWLQNAIDELHNNHHQSHYTTHSTTYAT
ncbi:trypsin alpha-3 [Drosophila grimshawi]|uniref:trypsin n=1 Tax=Drosophila grimshawi TaxID=7222 RepID=B4J4R5_DROGR|nr:trypsin alpha-3 [Drosophila grimshawi]EDW00611.1 GH20970 [Drosophila grimshawi]